MSSLPVVSDIGSPLGPGQIRFYQAAEPPLPAHAFQVTGTQTVVGLNDGKPTPTFSVTLPFTVSAPQFRLPTDTVQMSYPPANASGAFGNVLANIVLRSRTLPWVRTIDGSVLPAGSVAPPWMAVLTVTAAELGIPDSVQTPAPTFPGTVQRLVSPGAGTLGPSLNNLTSETLAEPVLLLDMALPLFQSVAPTLNDLPYLAHVREVNTDNKEILGLDEDGFFAVIIGNRLIQAREVNYHFLVSLEGFQGALPPATPPAGDSKIRLAVLAWWRVTATASRGNFIELMQGLPGAGGVSLLQSVYTPFTGDDVCRKTGPTTPTQVAAQALDLGYAPVETTMRIGEHATAWYRGPAAPVPLNPDALGPYLRSDAAMRYDPGTGIYDMSYAGAWEIGRLLALSSNAMAQSLYLWRREFAKSLLSQARQSAFTGRLAEAQSAIPRAVAASPGDTPTAIRYALANILLGLDLPGALALGAVPQRLDRAAVAPVAPAPGLCAPADHAACAADPDPIGRLLATVLAP
jgi:hypothetical protein